MKNVKKLSTILCALLMTLVFALTGISSISAAPQSTTINRQGVMVSYIGENYKWAKFATSDGKVAYCMDVEKTWPEKSTAMTLSEEANAGIKYILQNGYPNKSFTNGQNDDKDRFITQGAIWWYLTEIGQGTLSDDFKQNSVDEEQLRDKIKALVNGAKSAKASATTSVTVSVKNADMTLSNDKKYYVSEEIAPAVVVATKYSVSVTGAEGAIVTSTSGEAKNEFNAGEKFIVKLPASSVSKTAKLTVKISATGTESKAYVFTPADSSIQRTVALYTENVTKEASVTLNATKKESNKPSVCVDYVIVGNVKPDANLTDPTPGKSCYDKGTKYTQESELTTRQQNCKFNGWYTKEDLTGKWTNGDALNKDMTLYGAWECGSVINVPSTAANTPLVILAVGLVSIAGGLGVYFYRNKKLTANK